MKPVTNVEILRYSIDSKVKAMSAPPLGLAIVLHTIGNHLVDKISSGDTTLCISQGQTYHCAEISKRDLDHLSWQTNVKGKYVPPNSYKENVNVLLHRGLLLRFHTPDLDRPNYEHALYSFPELNAHYFGQDAATYLAYLTSIVQPGNDFHYPGKDASKKLRRNPPRVDCEWIKLPAKQLLRHVSEGGTE